MSDFVEKLKQKAEMDPDKHDGSYELVRSVVESYKNVPIKDLDFHDLNCIYLMTVGTWKHSYEKKKASINESHILDTDKNRLIELLDEIQNKAKNKQYENRERGQDSCGMFGTGFYSFEPKTDKESVQRFVKLCLEILPLDDDDQIFGITEASLKEKISGMEAASISQVLHCLKPFVFPILNGFASEKNVFSKLGVNLKNLQKSEFYVANCRKIKEFRDKNFKLKNYRIIDVCEAENDHEKGESGMNEEISNYVKLLEENHNIILHGAPGTGKTYLAKEIAKAMGAQWQMVQFHPSYDYTDFVEGLRPVKVKDSRDVGFTLVDGVFKDFCANAVNNLVNAKLSKSQKKVYQDNVVIDKTLEVFINKVEEELNEKGEIAFKGKMKITGINRDKKGDFQSLVIARSTDVSGQWLSSKIIYRDYIDFLNDKIKTERDIKPTNKSKSISHGNAGYYFEIYKRMKKCQVQIPVQQGEVEKKYVFIIDEINRGDMSKIFGELFYSIDPGYRGVGGAVHTQYANMVDGENESEFDKTLHDENKVRALLDGSKDAGSVESFMKDSDDYGYFFIPENVYIIGTMNDIDRSVESMDFAMRRRFTFEEVTAEQSAINFKLDDCAKEVMFRLNTAISRIQGLNSSYYIGAAYFKDFKENTDKELFWNRRLKGLLTEYLRGTRNSGDDLNKLKDAFMKKPIANQVESESLNSES